MSDDVRELLKLWLEYAENRRTLMSQLYAERHDPSRIQDLLDAFDRRLDEAIARTQRLLSQNHTG